MKEKAQLDLESKRRLEQLGFKHRTLDEESEGLRRFGSVEDTVRILSTATGMCEAEILDMPVELINFLLDKLEKNFINEEIPCQKRFLN